MIAKASAKYIRITPRKFRQIIPLVKGRPAEEALAILKSINKKASIYAIEILKSALANAKRLHEEIETANLRVSKLVADNGPMFKRYRAGSMGRASTVRKHTSHITVELDEIEHKPKKRIEIAPAKAKAKALKTSAKGR